MAIAHQIRELVDAFGELVSQHVRLARMELEEDARFVGIRIGLMATFAPLVLVGYGFLCVALAILLREVMHPALAFLLVGLLNLIGGGVGIALVARQLGTRKVLNESMSELENSTAMMLSHASTEDGP